MKKILVVLCVIFLLLAVIACNPLDGRADKDMIFRLVTDNQQLLLNCIEKNNFDELNWSLSSLSIREVDVNEDHVDFSCGGAGFGSQTAYRGFFYTENDDMYAVWCAPPNDQLLSADGAGYTWTEENGDNTYYVEKICDNFYYYDASF